MLFILAIVLAFAGAHRKSPAMFVAGIAIAACIDLSALI